MGGANLKIVSQAMGVDISQQNEKRNEKKQAKCRMLETRCQVSMEEGRREPRRVMWQSLVEIWSGSQYYIRSALPMQELYHDQNSGSVRAILS